uniref:Uncharacterized protein n=1 Tax=Romanomermis culicivorax TaxID=13658 RepID=A0A915I7G6_ROMCU
MAGENKHTDRQIFLCEKQHITFTIAKPTSAFFKAGPSFVPSPVTATTSRLAESLLSMIPLTSVYLSVGEDRANTRKRGQILSTNSCLTSPVSPKKATNADFHNFRKDEAFTMRIAALKCPIQTIIGRKIEKFSALRAAITLSISFKSRPSRIKKSSLGFKIPQDKAIERAVLTLSPVTMRTHGRQVETDANNCLNKDETTNY